MLKTLFVFSFVLFSHIANAAPKMIRWTGAEDANSQTPHLLDVLSQKTGHRFTEKDFLLQDSRELAYSQYLRFEQLKAGDTVDGRLLRVWIDLKTRKLIQVEAYLDIPGVNETTSERYVLEYERLRDAETAKLAAEAIRESRDPQIRGIEYKDRWFDGRFVRIVTITGKHGKTKLVIHHRSRKILVNEYREFPQADQASMSIPANVFPIYEETEDGSQRLERVAVTLDHLLAEVQDASGDIYAPLKKRRYFYDQYSPILGLTEEGRAQGYWSMSYIKAEAAKIRAALPLISNDFSRGMLLQGAYATVNIHPDAFKKFPGANFTPVTSPALFPNWVAVGQSYEMIPQTAFYGKPIKSADEAVNRPARRLADHNPVEYLNDGFDEIQVYYAINVMFETLRANGFTDPELSTRPFNAFLFNPDIEYKDNAYYTDDTINFTTYSPKAPNYARDNSTIWHELGHGVMDRLMGDNLVLADSGGLAEGMADFVAALIIQSVTQGKPFPGSNKFRIINQTGFSLTNESHDDGEAYGGAMKDLMDAMVLADKEKGLHKVTDVVLEAMRLTRDHPALDANVWFNAVLFADSLGREGLRAPGELKSIIIAALNGRNFRLDGGKVASMKLVNELTGREVEVNTDGYRYRPVQVRIKPEQTANLKLGVSLKSSPNYTFKYPVTVKVEFHKGALQGAVHWVGEESSPFVFTLNSDDEVAQIPLQVTGKCDFVNREDGTCSDYAYVQIFNHGEPSHPSAKKRFYVQVRN